MARPENPITATGPAAEFALELRELRRRAGAPTYREMARRVHYTAPALSGAAAGKRIPSWKCVEAYLAACGVTLPSELNEWNKRWNAAKDAANPAKATPPPAEASTPAAGSPSTPDGVAPRPALRAHPKLNHEIKVPDPEVVGTWNDLALGLEAVRRAANLSYRKLAANARPLDPTDGTTAPTLGTSSISEVLNGHRRPSLKWTMVYLAACGIDDAELRLWSDAYRRLKREEDRLRRAQQALNAVKANLDGDPTDTGQHNNLVNQLLEEMARRDPNRQATLEAMAQSKVRVSNAPGPRHRRPPTVEARITSWMALIVGVIAVVAAVLQMLRQWVG